MKISTKGRYALRIMIDLAMHNNSSEYISLKSISERQEITVKYLEQIIKYLQSARFVKSLRGNNGGYRLVKKADEYTVGEILRAIEGSLAPVACLDDIENNCPRKEKCLTLPFWIGLKKTVDDYLNSTTLLDLIKNADPDNFIFCE